MHGLCSSKADVFYGMGTIVCITCFVHRLGLLNTNSADIFLLEGLSYFLILYQTFVVMLI